MRKFGRREVLGPGLPELRSAIVRGVREQRSGHSVRV